MADSPPNDGASFDYDEAWQAKDDMKRYGPVSRHVRRLIKMSLRPLDFTSILDVGCGQGSLLAELLTQYPDMKPHGVDLSPVALEFARARVPSGKYEILDIANDSLDEVFDLVVCSEVLEHIPDDASAMRNLRRMTGKHLVVTTVQGRMRGFETGKVGHIRNYACGELVRRLEQASFEVVRKIEWGFPFYSPLYRNILDVTGARGTTGEFGPGRKAIAASLYLLFMLNSTRHGDEIVVVARPAEDRE